MLTTDHILTLTALITPKQKLRAFLPVILLTLSSTRSETVFHSSLFMHTVAYNKILMNRNQLFILQEPRAFFAQLQPLTFPPLPLVTNNF